MIGHKVNVINLEQGPREKSCYMARHLVGGEKGSRILSWMNHGIRGMGRRRWQDLDLNTKQYTWKLFSRSPVTGPLAQEYWLISKLLTNGCAGAVHNFAP